MPDDPKTPVYANALNLRISEHDVLLTFSVKTGDGPEEAVEVACVGLTRDFWETTVPWMQRQLDESRGKAKEKKKGANQGQEDDQ